MKVINFFGGPGIGKSVSAAGLFFEMKTKGRAVELVTEYAKDVTWEGRQNLLDDQLYLLAKQNRRLSRLLDHPLDYAITDSPILLGAAYCRMGPNQFTNLVPLVVELFNSYDNINIVLERDPSFYQQVGRSQTLEQAKEIDKKVIDLLDEFNVPYISVTVSQEMSGLQLVSKLHDIVTK